jgi:two-component system response regulator (stage 0 sporulation protein F)
MSGLYFCFGRYSTTIYWIKSRIFYTGVEINGINISWEVRTMKKILIVDDQKGVRRLLEELFKKDGWEVELAADGKEAVESADKFLPDIILMDMKMPNMNGLEASQIILKKYNNLDIIMMTAYGEMDVVKEALDAGVKRCITKPFDIIDLRNTVNQMATGKVS